MAVNKRKRLVEQPHDSTLLAAALMMFAAASGGTGRSIYRENTVQVFLLIVVIALVMATGAYFVLMIYERTKSPSVKRASIAGVTLIFIFAMIGEVAAIFI